MLPMVSQERANKSVREHFATAHQDDALSGSDPRLTRLVNQGLAPVHKNAMCPRDFNTYHTGFSTTCIKLRPPAQA